MVNKPIYFFYVYTLVSLVLFSNLVTAAPAPDIGEFFNGVGDALGSITAPITNAITGKKEKDAEIENLRKKTQELQTQSEQIAQTNQAQNMMMQQYVDRFGFNVVNRLNTNDFVTAKTHLQSNNLKTQFNGAMAYLTGDAPNMFMSSSSSGGKSQPLQNQMTDPSLAQMMPQQIPQQVPQMMGQQMPQQMPQMMDQQMPQQMPQMMGQQMPQMMDQQMPQNQQMVDPTMFQGQQATSIPFQQTGLTI